MNLLNALAAMITIGEFFRGLIIHLRNGNLLRWWRKADQLSRMLRTAS